MGVACVMEYISFIKGEAWSDTPKCVDPDIAETAISLNDAIVDDDLRSRYLVPLLGKIIACEPVHHLARREFWDMVEKVDSDHMVVTGADLNTEHEVEEAVRWFEMVLDMFIDHFNLTDMQVDEAEMQAATAGILAKVL